MKKKTIKENVKSKVLRKMLLAIREHKKIMRKAANKYKENANVNLLKRLEDSRMKQAVAEEQAKHLQERRDGRRVSEHIQIIGTDDDGVLI